MKFKETILKTKKIWLYLILLVFTLISFIYWSSKKEIWFCDEIYTYESANGVVEEGDWPYTDTGIWIGGSDMEKFFAADSDYFLFGNISAQLYGDHVPLYFWLFRVVSFLFFKGSASIWIGLSINLVFLLAAVSVVYFVLSDRIGEIQSVLVILAGMITSRAGIEQYTFLRMYMMLLCMMFLLLYFGYVIVKDAEENKKISVVGLIGMYFSSLFGFMTHYDFWIFYAFEAGLVCMYLCIRAVIVSKKNKTNFFKSKEMINVYLWFASFLLSLFTLDRLFPYWKWNLRSGKGESALSSVSAFSIEKIKNIIWGFEVLSKHSFGKIPVILGLSVFVAAIVFSLIIFKKEKEKMGFKSFVFALAIIILYHVTVCFTFPSGREERYLWCSITLFQICLCIAISIIVNYLMKKKKMFMIIGIASALVITAANFVIIENGREIAYLFYEDKDVDLLKSYKDIPWVVYGPTCGVYSMYDLVIPEELCFIDDTKKDEAENALSKLENSDSFILYANEAYLNEAVELTGRSTGAAFSTTHIGKSVFLDIYLLERE